MVPHRILRNFKVLGNFPVLKSLSNQQHDLLLAFGQEDVAAGVGEPDPRPRPKGFQNIEQLLTIRPYLTVMHSVKALAKRFARLAAAANSQSAGAEGSNHHVAIEA